MKAGVLGTGVVGQVIAEKLVELGHNVKMGTRDIKDTLARNKLDGFGRPPVAEWLKANPKIELTTLAEAAAYGDILISAMSGSGVLSALEMAGKVNLADKTLLDISNPLDFSNGFPPSLSICNTDSLAEQIQRAFPDTKLVKSLNTMTAFVMVNPRVLPESHNVFLSGNDKEAKQQVADILLSFGWEKPEIIDLGDLTTARGTEQLLPIWVRLYGKLQNAMFNFKIVQGNQPA